MVEKKKGITTGQIALIGGVGVLGFLLFSRGRAPVSAGGVSPVTNIIEGIKGFGSGVADVVKGGASAIAGTGAVAKGAGAVVGGAGQVVGGITSTVGKDIQTAGEVTKKVAKITPFVTGIEPFQSLRAFKEPILQTKKFTIIRGNFPLGFGGLGGLTFLPRF